MDERAEPYGDFFQNAGCYAACEIQPQARAEIQYASVLVYRQGASGIKEFYTLPVGRELLQYDSIAVNTIVKNKTGEVSSCDVPFSSSLVQFNADYLQLTHAVAENCENHDLTDSMVIGTSAIVDTEIDGAVGMNSGIFNNPFLIWGKYHKGLFRTTLKLSFQFHHTQMDGAHAGRFLQRLSSVPGLPWPDTDRVYPQIPAHTGGKAASQR